MRVYDEKEERRAHQNVAISNHALLNQIPVYTVPTFSATLPRKCDIMESITYIQQALLVRLEIKAW